VVNLENLEEAVNEENNIHRSILRIINNPCIYFFNNKYIYIMSHYVNRLKINRNKPPSISRKESLEQFKPKFDIYGTNLNKFKRQNSENYDSSPSRSTSSMSSDSSEYGTEYGNPRRMVPKKIYYNNEDFFFPAYEIVQYKKPIIPNNPKSIKDDPIAIAIFEKIKKNIENNNFEEIEFNPEELVKISNIKELADFSDEYHRYIEEQNDLRSFGGKFKKSKRRYKSNKSRKGGKYRKTRKGGKSKNKKTRKH